MSTSHHLTAGLIALGACLAPLTGCDDAAGGDRGGDRPGQATILSIADPADQPADPAGQAVEPVDFSRDVLPILSNHCFHCHGPDQHSAEAQRAGFRLDQRDESVGFGYIEPGDADASTVMEVLTTSKASRKMPPLDSGRAQLTAGQVDIIRRWIDQGAPYSAHWSFVKPVKPEPPAVADPAWCRNGIDFFVQAKLAANGLTPNDPADKHRLIRRVYLDLIGLPPTPEQVDAFINDRSPDAYEKVVDGLLASPRFGEQWAGPWLDKARYADSQGFEKDRPRTMWRYRDWVINALNTDMPFDRFTREQLAGDLLDDPTLDQLIATGLHRNTQTNTEGGTDDEEFRSAAIIDRVNTTMEVWMGMTMGCAQCHTHKFDPIQHEEYYRFYAFFNQTADADYDDDRPTIPAPTPEQQQEIDRLQRELDAVLSEFDDAGGALAQARQRWERTATDSAVVWRPLAIESAEADHGVTLERLDDGSLRADGVDPDTATYTITARTDLAGITAVRLEAVADEALPQGGPGRAGNGNFVVNDLSVVVEPATGAAPPPRARYLRVDLPGQGRILSLAEVQAFAGGENASMNARVMQSSTDFAGLAVYAIDGITDSEMGITHTTTEDDPWWELDFERQRPIEKVVIWNRSDGGLHKRLDGAVVTLLDEDRRPVWSRRLGRASVEPVELVTTGPQPVMLRDASSTFDQDGWPVTRAIDADAGARSGWAVMPRVGQTHTAVFETAVDAGHAGGTTLRVRIVQSHGSRHTLGRFRLSVTDQPRPVRELPTAIRELLAVAPDQRTPEQAERLDAYFIEIAPEAQAIRGRVADLRQQLAAAQSRVPTALIMRELPEGQRRQTYLFNGGSFLAPDKERGVLTPGTPAVLHPFPEDAPRDRLGLAQWLTHADNPLTARVQVNRVWEQVWGVGLVETTNDFGFQGSYPSNKDLLDYLAVTYPQDLKWSTKGLIRLIVTSSAYRQSAAMSSDRAEIDPYNRMMSRGPRVRLSAEQVRDQALAIAGLLKTDRVGGPSVIPYVPEGMLPQAFDSFVQQSSSGDDVYRRGLYTAWRRTGHYPSFATFDAPSREVCTIIRSRTNTPLQALVTLNDPVYVEAAQVLGRRLIKEAGEDLDARLTRGVNLALARDPSAKELDVLRTVYRESLAEYKQDAESATLIATDPAGPLPEGVDAADAAAMTLVGNVILNLDEVINKP